MQALRRTFRALNAGELQAVNDTDGRHQRRCGNHPDGSNVINASELQPIENAFVNGALLAAVCRTVLPDKGAVSPDVGIDDAAPTPWTEPTRVLWMPASRGPSTAPPSTALLGLV